MLPAYETHIGAMSPQRWMLILHGIWGRRANWRTFARQWQARRPSWGVALVDLRMHGDSQGFPPPHTVERAAADLLGLLGLDMVPGGQGRVAGVLGHSFGGKVAISFADQALARGQPLDELWIIDAPIGPRTDPLDRSTLNVFEVLASLPPRFEQRREFVAMLEQRGLDSRTSQWLATNLVADEAGGWRIGIQLSALREMLDDFMKIDLWPALRRVSEAGTEVGLVVGGNSQAVFGEQRELAEQAAATGVLSLDVIPGAGHWVHVDQPAALLDVVAAAEPLG